MGLMFDSLVQVLESGERGSALLMFVFLELDIVDEWRVESLPALDCSCII